MLRGRVLNIQRYCIHDGPGIRTTVFLKGCPLRCWWCHNPESQPAAIEVGWIEARCVRCGQCALVCPQHPEKPDPSADECLRCGACVDACPTGARQWLGREMSVREVLDEVLRDRIFFEDSGGGVTFSGGEPLVQAEFLAALLEACRAASIPTAVDTCGYAAHHTLLRLAPLVDVFLYDIKAIDDAVHRSQTGVSNALILENLAALSAHHNNVWIRLPLIPGVNDHAEQLRAVATFLRSLPGIRRIDVLPYHKLGRHKGRQGADVQPPSDTQLRAAAAVFQQVGLFTLVGGPP